MKVLLKFKVKTLGALPQAGILWMVAVKSSEAGIPA